MTRKLPTKFELIRRAKAREAELLRAIQLMCGDCMGLFLNPYMPCTSDKCPLRSYYPTKGRAKSPSFKKDLVELTKAYDNHPDIVSEINKLEPEIASSQCLKTPKENRKHNHVGKDNQFNSTAEKNSKNTVAEDNAYEKTKH